jgi:hypothetical protein
LIVFSLRTTSFAISLVFGNDHLSLLLQACFSWFWANPRLQVPSLSGLDDDISTSHPGTVGLVSLSLWTMFFLTHVLFLPRAAFELFQRVWSRFYRSQCSPLWLCAVCDSYTSVCAEVWALFFHPWLLCDHAISMSLFFGFLSVCIFDPRSDANSMQPSTLLIFSVFSHHYHWLPSHFCCNNLCFWSWNFWKNKHFFPSLFCAFLCFKRCPVTEDVNQNLGIIR